MDWKTAVMLTVTNSSFANEKLTDVDPKKNKEHRSQKAILNAIASPDIIEDTEADCHVISWQSVTNKRVCNSMLQAEAHKMMVGTDQGDRFRAIIAGMGGSLDLRNWERSVNTTMQHVWLSDCNSPVSHLHNAVDTRLENTRLSIDIRALRQRWWFDPDGEAYEETRSYRHRKKHRTCYDELTQVQCVLICLTKKMKAGCLWDVIKATPESIVTKMRKSMVRRKTVDDENTAESEEAQS